MKRWIVVHELEALSAYAAFRRSLEQVGEEVEFVELNFWQQAKAIIRRRRKNQWRKTLTNAWRLLQFAFDGAREQRVVLGIAPYNPWLLPVRWLLRNAQVHVHSSWPYWDGSKQPHVALLPVVKQTWQTFMTREVRHVLIATQLAKTNLERSRFGGAPVTVVAHSFDDRIFHPGEPDARPPSRMIYVGRLDISKGMDLIMEVAARLPHCEVVLIGYGPLRRQVESQARRLPNVSYLGEISDRSRLADELRKSQVLLLPSIRVPTWEELFGMVLIEAMACGLVPLTTDHVGPLEVMGSRFRQLCFTETGFVEGACRQVLLWQEDPDAFLRDREAALTIASHYTTDRIAQRWSRALGIEAAEAQRQAAPVLPS